MTKRRTWGDGGLTQRADGRWQGSFRVTVDGKRRTKYVYGRTKGEAKRKLDKARAERDAGTLVLTSPTVEKWLTYWLDHIAARDLKPQTVRGYRGYLSKWLVPVLGHRRLTTLQPEHIRDLHDQMRASGCAEATVRQAHAILKKSLRDAVFEGKLVNSPADRVKSPGTYKRKRPQLTVEQAQQVLRYTDDARWWLALFYGLRQGEVLGLRWCDIDLDRRTLTVAQSLQVTEDGGVIFGRPKSESSLRTMPLVPLMHARLLLHWETSGRPTGDGLVFTRSDGSPRDRYADYKAWKRLLDDATRIPFAPLPPVALHSARMTAASVLEAAGISDRVVAQILGHSQVQITHGYQDADGVRIAAAFEAAGRLLELD